MNLDQTTVSCTTFKIIVSLCNRTAGKKKDRKTFLVDKYDRAFTCVFHCDLHIALLIRTNVLTISIVTLVTQGLTSSFHCLPTAQCQYYF